MKVSDRPCPHVHLCAMLATETLTCIARLTGLYSDYWRGYIHGLFETKVYLTGKDIHPGRFERASPV